MQEWQRVCRIEDLVFERGMSALAQGQPLAVFLMPDGQVYALGNHDPGSPGRRLTQGIVGRRDGVPFVAPAGKRRRFDLRTGLCLDDPHLSVPAYAVRVTETPDVGKVVEIGPRLKVRVA